ncbi:tight adherence protein B [Amycolatopsis bartoniae]|uniref:Type II secretion system protein n=1 Tax=Amycolatopsis bartoniae TaxID=941986 RepID=A0A8H9J4T3_9PSEU|nr:hypothetical protein [Amycolatopsis bartoniae]MBB2935173.1 tight adherence protein B [Amycolatopsis bartoniae]TVT07042.1 hypothetical protein FNH07_18090 [Amycolatopsis bartoniae]GHF74881.1 type II secretion system protein [Amycolatopsis bartoniae]
MLSIAALCAAVALLTWPVTATSQARLAALTARGPSRGRPRFDRRWLLLLAVVPVLVLLGPFGVVAAGMLVLAVRCHRRSRQRLKADLRTAAALAEALGAAVAELRSGAPPATAAEVAARDVSGEARLVMRALSTSARFGVVDQHETGLPGQVARAWSLSQRHGLPLAELLDAVRRDFVARTRFVTRADANMAGPRASAAVLAFLPGVGVLLGEGMGARPLHVLATTAAGHVLLLLGTGLILGGVAWSVRLTKLVVGP